MATGLFRRLNGIAEINDSKETWKVAVRLINMWRIHRSPKSTIELKFMDKEGDKIVAQMKNVDEQLLKVNFQIGDTYIIQNFEVDKNSGQYKATHHLFKINFIKATKITPIEIPDIPDQIYNFTMFQDIANGSASPDFLIDVIGEVVDIGQRNLDGKPKKVVFTLKDECGSVISCTLWEGLAIKFKDCFDKHDSGPMVLLLTMAKIKEARGSYPIAIQNSMYGSDFFMNTNIKEILDFKDRMDPSQISLKTCTELGTQVSSSSVYSIADRFLHNAEVKSLDQISQVKTGVMCVTVATITKLLVANGWIYDACPKCNKKVDVECKPFVCVGCGNQSGSMQPRFRVEVRVSQPYESANFTLWDRECVALINETAVDIKQKIITEEGKFDPRDIPEALDRLLGQKVAFKFKVIHGNTRHSVSQISQDQTLITSILAKLPTLCEKDETDPSISSVSLHHDGLESQCFSATAEFDPNSISSVTPAKRNLGLTDSELENMPFEDLSQIQISCTRLSKHIKTE